MGNSRVFVYVVCGDDSHIDTLNFSLKYLRQFSRNRIIVVTDTSRNNKEIEHNDILNVATPEKFTHHQASIYLKTGLHKFLPEGNMYCYIDTDVIAMSSSIEEVFNEFEAPVVFAADHCRMPEFSPYAVNCSCNATKKEKYAKLDKLQLKHNPNMGITDPILQEKAKQLINIFNIEKQNKWTYMGHIARYFFSYRRFVFNEDFYYDKQKKVWYYADGRPVLFDIKGYYRKIEKESFFKWNNKRQIWLDDTGENAYIAYCNHLSERIKEKFNIQISDNNWQHWNGGVFLFNDTSHDFMNTWHNYSLAIFDDPSWKTRDQGTLIATAWHYELKNHKKLPQKFNFIADYHKRNLCYDTDKGFSTDKFKTTIAPSFIHIYHEFGRKDWDVWQAVEAVVQEEQGVAR